MHHKPPFFPPDSSHHHSITSLHHHTITSWHPLEISRPSTPRWRCWRRRQRMWRALESTWPNISARTKTRSSWTNVWPSSTLSANIFFTHTRFVCPCVSTRNFTGSEFNYTEFRFQLSEHSRCCFDRLCGTVSRPNDRWMDGWRE